MNNNIPEEFTLSTKNNTNRQNADLWKKNRRLRRAWEKAQQTGNIYSHIAYALARGCVDLYYVNLDTGEFIEYSTDDEHGMLKEIRRAPDFFESCKQEAGRIIYPEDQDTFVNAMNRETLRKNLEEFGEFRMTYRRIKDGRTFYVLMKVSWMEDDDRFVVISVFDVDELVTRRKAEERMQEERLVYARLHAVTGNFLAVYVVDPESGSYREFSSTEEYEKSLEMPKEGTDFFSAIRNAVAQSSHQEDTQLFLETFTEENVKTELESSGIFTLGFRIILKGRSRHVQMKAAMVEEPDGSRMIIGLNDIDVQIRQEERIRKRLQQAQSQANIDALTGIKNKHAYQEAEKRLNNQIVERRVPPFAIVMLDLNDLKKVNDTAGHQAGDQYIKDGSKIICDIFKHSPVFRIGGDEFAVIAQGSDYENIENRMEEMKEHNEEAMSSFGVVIACGMSKFEKDATVGAVFERADHAMYENKAELKAKDTAEEAHTGLIPCAA